MLTQHCYIQLETKNMLCSIAKLTYLCIDSNKASLVISLNKYEQLINVPFIRKITTLYFLDLIWMVHVSRVELNK